MDYVFKNLLNMAGEMNGNISSVNYNGTDYCSVKIAVGDTAYDFTVIKKEME